MSRRNHRRSQVNRAPWRLVPALLLGIVIAAVAFSPTLSPLREIGVDREAGLAAAVTETLNLRSAPTLDSAVIDVLEPGVTVEVTGESRHGFAPVRHGDRNGWLAVEYLSFGNSVDVEDSPVVAAAAMAPVDEEDEPAAERDVDAPSVAEPTAVPERWILIDRSDATVTLYEGKAAIATFAGRIGRDESLDGFYSTAVGTYHVYSMNKGLAQTPFAEDTYLSHWVGFDPVRHNGIHSPVRNADGTVREWQNATTLGCVRLGEEDAVTVFEFASIGMRVVVRE